MNSNVQQPNDKASDIGYASGTSNNYCNNETEMPEAYKPAYEADQEFSDKIAEYGVHLSITRLATTEPFKPVIDASILPDSEQFKSEVDAVITEQDYLLVGVAESKFGLTLSAESFHAINNAMDYPTGVNIKAKEVKIVTESAHYDDRWDSMAYNLTPDLMRLLVKNTIVACEQARKDYIEIVGKCVVPTLKFFQEDNVNSDVRLQNLHNRLPNNIIFITWFSDDVASPLSNARKPVAPSVVSESLAPVKRTASDQKPRPTEATEAAVALIPELKTVGDIGDEVGVNTRKMNKDIYRLKRHTKDNCVSSRSKLSCFEF